MTRPAPLLLLAVLAACGGPPPAPPTPSPGCASVWADSAAAALVETLEAATSSRRPVWGDYRLGDGWTVIHAGRSEAGGACVGAWTDGRAVAYGELSEAPELPSPVFGFYVPEGTRGPVPSQAEQPPSVVEWLESNGVGRATLIPVAVEGFAVEMTPLMKVQVALHEGFHARTLSLRWRLRWWPRWDRQPDRDGLAACYRATPAVAAALEAERSALVRTVESLLDDDAGAACLTGAEFLARRAARYALLDAAGVTVARRDSTPGSCREAESIMELEEGTADYASWTQLFAAGLTSRARLMDRYRSTEADAYYLMGAMQLHALSLMTGPDGMAGVARRIARSRSPDDGSITAVFRDALAETCRASGPGSAASEGGPTVRPSDPGPGR